MIWLLTGYRTWLTNYMYFILLVQNKQEDTTGLHNTVKNKDKYMDTEIRLQSVVLRWSLRWVRIYSKTFFHLYGTGHILTPNSMNIEQKLTAWASSFSNLRSSKVQSSSRGRSRSQTILFTLATTVLSARPWLEKIYTLTWKHKNQNNNLFSCKT